MAQSQPSSILVLGAGELGTAVLEELSKHPSRSASTTLTVLLREITIASPDPKKRKELGYLQSLGVNFLGGDTSNDSEAELASKFAPFDMVISCTGFSSPPGTQTRITKAVLAAGINRYIPWQFGVDYDIIGRGSSQDLFTEQLDVRDLLRGQEKTSWIIVSTGMFMSFIFEDFFGVVTADRGTVRALGSWENSVTMTNARDIGRMVAEIVFVETEIGHEVVYLAADTVSYGHLADLVEEATGKAVQREEWPVEYLKDEAKKGPDNAIRKYRIVFAEGTGVSWGMDKSLNAKKGIKLENVREWLERNPV